MDLQKGVKICNLLYLTCNDRTTFSLPLTKFDFGHVRMYATPYPFACMIFILDWGPSNTDKLLRFPMDTNWAPLVLLRKRFRGFSRP